MTAEEVNELGYTDARQIAGRWCAVGRMIFTTGLIVGIDPWTYEYRYCYEHRHDAVYAIRVWDRCGHPPGPWIKLKGIGLDELNPDWSGDEALRSAA